MAPDQLSDYSWIIATDNTTFGHEWLEVQLGVDVDELILCVLCWFTIYCQGQFGNYDIWNVKILHFGEHILFRGK